MQSRFTYPECKSQGIAPRLRGHGEGFRESGLLHDENDTSFRTGLSGRSGDIFGVRRNVILCVAHAARGQQPVERHARNAEFARGIPETSPVT